MEKLGKDVLVLIALEMSYPEVLKFCTSSSRINKAVCKNNDFWRNMLSKSYPHTYPKLMEEKTKDYRKLYEKTETEIKKLLAKKVEDPTEGGGFLKPKLITPELANFLTYANFGFLPGTEIPLNVLLEPLIKNKTINHGILVVLFHIYSRVNQLGFYENGKKYYQAGPDMEKYLGNYLTSLEDTDKAKSDEEMENRLRFDRNKFLFNAHSRIFNKGILGEGDIPLSTISKIRQVLIDINHN